MILWNLMTNEELIDRAEPVELRDRLKLMLDGFEYELEKAEESIRNEVSDDCDRLQEQIDQQQEEINERDEYIEAVHDLLDSLSTFRSKPGIITAIATFRRETKEPT